MIGGAILEISQEQMTQALQEWLDRNWTVDSPVVTAICVNYGSTKFQPETFRLGLKSNKAFIGVAEVVPGGAGDPA